MEIKDYLHLYLGCQMRYNTHHEPQNEPYILTAENLAEAIEFAEKPILRPLSDMTDEEMDEVWYSHEPKNVLVMEYTNSGMVRKVALCSERTRYLLSKGFDLFGLIDAGLALDKHVLKEKPTPVFGDTNELTRQV